MDQIYEEYEFLEAQNENQFLVLQNDGTLLTVNKPIQYITQSDEVKPVQEEDGPAKYDDSQQEFFVNDSEELITDQFVVSNSDNNDYANNFLLKTIENENSEDVNNQIPDYAINNLDAKEDTIIMENQEITNEYEEVSVIDNYPDDKPPEDCTEITLTDEQYQILQEKGWILLEANDKKYLLDAAGLHDITNNEDLIEKLRNGELNPEPEMESVEPTKEDAITVVDNDDPTLPMESENTNIVTQVFSLAPQVEESRPAHTLPEIKRKNIVQKVVKANAKDVAAPKPKAKAPEKKKPVTILTNNPIKIKTKYLFKDIPSRIVLGKTSFGKNLVARVVKTNRPTPDSTGHINNQNPYGPNYTGISEIRFESLVRQKLNETEEKRNAKDIAAAETVVKQLLQVPAFRPVVSERQLVITKSILSETAIGSTYWESRCSLVTGRVGAGQRFAYEPRLLKKLLSDGEAILYFRRNQDLNEGSFLHIHVTEKRAADGVVRVSITLNKRHLPLKLVKEQIKVYQNTMFACSACAEVYGTERELVEHQESECMETDPVDVSDTAEASSSYTVMEMNGNKQYVCNQCQMGFTKLSNCQSHISTHVNDKSSDDKTAKPKQVLKCKMCPSTFQHPATLSKHIVTKHIKGVSMLNNHPKIIKAKSIQSLKESSDNKPKGKDFYYKCKLCPSSYVHPATLTKHILSEHVKNM